jgi:surface polysaccharide O-acyltransferase-like enzyme
MIFKNQSTKTRINKLDFLRAFAVLAVIMIHTVAKIDQIKSLNSLVFVNVFIDVASHFAVPVFIIVSGIVLSYNYYEHINYKSYYIKRFFSIIPQFLFFSLFYLIVSNLILDQRSPSILKVIYRIFTGRASYHLWFFIILIQFYLVYPLLIKLYIIFSSRHRLRTFIIMSFLIQILYYFISNYLYTEYDQILLRLFDYYIRHAFLSYIFYFVIGIYFGRNLDSMKNYINNANNNNLYFLLILSNVIIYLIRIKEMETPGYEIDKLSLLPSEIIEPLQYILSFILLWKIASKLIERNDLVTSLLKDIGKFSFGIYLIHVFFIMVLIRILEPLNITYSDWIFYPIIFFCVSALSYLTCKIISYIPFSYYIIGIKS